MENHTCLNCNHETIGRFCSNCGQKTETHRIKIGHFIMHDMLHGVWHLEKGILFTLKETFTRPGKAALDYISGKRIRYYNVFYLSLLLIGLNLLLSHFYDGFRHEDAAIPKEGVVLRDFFSKYLKLILLGIVPILALNSILVFRRLKLNLAEHFIINGISLVGMLVISIFFSLMSFLNDVNATGITGVLEIFFFFLIPLFLFWVYWNATRSLYSFAGFVWRIVAFYVLVLLQLAIILGVIVHAVTGKNDLYVNI